MGFLKFKEISILLLMCNVQVTWTEVKMMMFLGLWNPYILFFKGLSIILGFTEATLKVAFATPIPPQMA